MSSSERPLRLLIPLTLLVACAPDRDFAERMQALGTRTRAVAAAAARCADDLRALSVADPEAVRRAFDDESGIGRQALVRPWSDRIGRRSLQEIDRREGTARAALPVIANALEVGPAALERVLAATERSRDASRTLCTARDTAETIALMTHDRTWRRGEAVSVAR